MGWEATETVVHEHDDAGQLVASRSTRDVEWDPWQRALALALVDLENATGPHGHPLWEALDPTAEDPDGDYRYAVDVEPEFVERAIARVRKQWIADHPDDDPSTVRFVARKVTARE